MKKLISIIAFITVIILSCSGCMSLGGGTAARQTANTTSEDMSSVVFPTDFESLTKKFESEGYVDPSSKASVLADVIGANAGCRYKSNLGDQTFYIELYYFDPSNPLDEASTFINEINQTGYFTLMQTQTPATMSDNGKYMMVYGNIQKDDTSTENRDKVMETFKTFP